MSRSGYSDDWCGSQEEQWALIRWRGAVKAAMRGKRGQRLLVELRDGLDAMDEKKLIAHHLEKEGCYCALGVVGKDRGIALDKLNPLHTEVIADTFDIAEAMVREIVFINDEHWDVNETDEQRWSRVRGWVSANIKNKREEN